MPNPKPHTFDIDPHDEPDMNWEFDSDPTDSAATQGVVGLDFEPEKTDGKELVLARLKSPKFLAAPNASLNIVGTLSEIGNVILDAIDLNKAAAEGIESALEDVEKELAPFFHEQKLKTSAEISHELQRDPNSNGEGTCYLWAESDCSIFTSEGGVALGTFLLRSH